MTIITIANSKGGTGKTTIAVHLAFWLKRRGSNICLLDCDRQKSASHWAKLIGLKTEAALTPEETFAFVKRKQWDYLICDSIGTVDETTRALIDFSDVILVPCQPSALDISATNNVLEMIKQARWKRNNEKPLAFSIINRAIANTNLLSDTITYLDSLAIKRLPQIINQRQAIADSFSQSRTVFSMDSTGASKAKAEFEQLFEEVFQCLEDEVQ